MGRWERPGPPVVVLDEGDDAFGTRTMRSWYSTKHGREMTEREWRKCHLMCGTSTHVVLAAVSGAKDNDSPFLPDLLAVTAAN